MDIVDETYLEKYHPPTTYKLEVVKAYWPNHKIHLHIMSKYPSRYLDEIIKFADIIYIHYEIMENLLEVRNRIHQANKRFGIVLHGINEYDNIEEIIKLTKDILVLSIEKPGYSGQKFLETSNKIISQINSLQNKTSINLCIDGGINRSNLSKISADLIVSGSSVLKNNKPIREIMTMQTLSRYEK